MKRARDSQDETPVAGRDDLPSTNGGQSPDGDGATDGDRGAGTGTDPGTGGGSGRRAVFRTPAPALLVVFLLLVCMLPVAFALPGLQLLLLVPLGLAVWILRNRTTATRDGLSVRTVSGTRELPWDGIRGLSLTPKSSVGAVLVDGTTVPLPGVRTRHLPVIALVSEGRLPDPSGVLDRANGTGSHDADDTGDTDDTGDSGASGTPDEHTDPGPATGDDGRDGHRTSG
ncbi:PH domain-containing protein [Saccharomonospora halophila]|uniref:PH domain-containing protein n=1 Tax=Saccharomonospora halophila TaxID=129922 RepID=UPI00036D7246|nr:PH domain-containing protein [Saccharomonospora halophila]